MTPSPLKLFSDSLTPCSKVALVGGSAAEIRAMLVAGHLPYRFDYSEGGSRYELPPRVPRGFDGLYCAHTLEHVRNVGVMLDAMYVDLKDNGLLCIVVPPAKHNIVGGHLTLWNAGLLLYNLIRAHFDCSKAAIRTEGYDVAVMVRKAHADYQDSDLIEDNGDLEQLARFFPVPMPQNQDGQISLHDWVAR